ncbi:MAG: hypothetical protein CMH22_15845 [Methylophaga sp.]|uniref:hypothetical protein n=1 Tax=Methylophaga sp. UBA678 TaxID=1946901 RepID=UPI000C68C898|nr:hypothetical protein [Methylophaga sp. UBA678]MAX53448.1 hypothetical protein [Methylophaga sp.]|tara:strand:- start:357 stop:563 length:207 start_codon:yes stop_codon:yes gene_type:complete
MIPSTYDEWYVCIVDECKIELNQNYINERLSILTNDTLEESRIFRKKYGDKHWRDVIGWFNHVKQENA